MKKNKIILINGLSTSGKTTASYNLAKKLPSFIFIDIWRIKDLFEPLGLKDRKDIISISKKIIISLTREVMKKMKKDIILQEIQPSFIKKHIRKELKKYHYEIYSIYLTVDFKHAIKRDIKRKKLTMDIRKNWDEERWIMKIKKNLNKGDIVIDTSKYNSKQVIDIILKNIKEKPKKHFYLNKIKKYN
jgi:cytidylate kinase